MKSIAIALENTFDKNNCVMLHIVRNIIVRKLAWKIATSKIIARFKLCAFLIHDAQIIYELIPLRVTNRILNRFRKKSLLCIDFNRILTKVSCLLIILRILYLRNIFEI